MYSSLTFMSDKPDTELRLNLYLGSELPALEAQAFETTTEKEPSRPLEALGSKTFAGAPEDFLTLGQSGQTLGQSVQTIQSPPFGIKLAA